MQRVVIYILIQLFSPYLLAQSPSVFIKSKGIPYIRNYSANEYNADVFNHDIVQDNRGIMYFGNNSGVLEYDGDSWRLIKLTNESLVYSLGLDKVKNRVYVGGVGEFGYLTSDKKGKTMFISLLSKVPESLRSFQEVRNIVVMDNQVIFRTHAAIFIFKEGTIKVIEPQKANAFHVSFYFKKDFYLREKGIGLKKLVNGKLQLIPQGEFLANILTYAILPYDHQNWLIITRKGFFLYNGSSFKPWETEISNHLNSYRVYYCKSYQDKYFLIGTLRKGLFILNKQGRVIQHLDQSKGLINSSIYNSLVDKDHNIWIATNKGLSHILLSSGFTVYNRHIGLSSNLSSSIYSLSSQQLYIGTMQGGFFTQKKAQSLVNNDHPLFKELPLNNILDIYQIGNTLLIGHTDGIWAYNESTKKGYEIAHSHFVRKFIPTLRKKTLILVSTRNGLLKVSKKEGRWQTTKIKKSTDLVLPYFTEYKKGILLASNNNGLLSKITLNTQLDSVIKQKRYSTQQGLPQNRGNRVFRIKDETLIATQNGIYQYIDKKDLFIPHPVFSKIIGNLSVRHIKSDPLNNLWIWAGKASGLSLVFLKKTLSSYQIIRTPFQKLKNTFMELGTHINPIDGQNVLFSAPEGAIHFDPSIPVNYNRPYKCLIRKVETMEDKDSLIFGGNLLDKIGNITSQQDNKVLKRLAYKHNNLRFSFAATFYENHNELTYSHFLKGFDPHWSNWLNDNQKEYTNIPEGKYTFYVKARNIYGKESIIATYSFKIYPPWYRTIWAYLSYTVIGILIVWWIVYLNIRRLKRQKKKLEKTVQVRTAEIVEKNNILHMQKEEITAQAEDLKTQKEELEVLNENISDKNRIIEKKNKDIIASINYARRIQTAMLPQLELVQQTLPETFIFFKPRDIVSGDFYWFAEVERTSLNSSASKYIIIAADCTGHGVPGAFVSMVGNELLNEIVKMRGIQKPSLILEWLNEGIKRVFRYKETRSRDGMDIAICTIDREQKVIEFAGAHNPLVYVKNGEQHVIKGDRVSIGERWPKKMRGYTHHEVSLDTPVTFYLFSDGFQDQFGGEKGKKFMRSKFYKLLYDISSLAMQKQSDMLDHTFNQWKGDFDQIDDILVLGVKVG